MDYLFTLPAYIKVSVSFFGILVAYRWGLGLGYSILAFAAALTLWTGTGAVGCRYQMHSLLSPENYLLLAVILLLLFFTEALDKTGKMKRTVAALESWCKSPRLLCAGFPAMVGLLPMPGGALFSAPLVAAADPENRLAPAHKAAINYWFRHIWEYWWPLYPGIILAVKYSGLSSGLFFLIQMPFTIVAAAAGYAFIVSGIGEDGPRASADAGAGRLDIRNATSALWPIGVLVAVSLAGSFALPLLGGQGAHGMTRTLGNLVGMLAGLVIGLFSIFWNNIPSLPKALPMFARKNTWEMMLLVLGIQVFSGALTIPLPSANTLTVPLSHGGFASPDGAVTLVTSLRNEFVRMGVPLVLVIALIPFISGAVTGVAFGFVGASFPIVFALLGASPPLHVVCAATTFAFGCGYMGMILSPVHICFVVTNEYFKSGMFAAYRYILMPVLVVLAAGCLMSVSYYYLFK